MPDDGQDLDLVVTRRFEAPVARVWRAWTESEQVMRWWGPRDFTSPRADMDVREGGTSLVSMRSPDGHDMHNTWTYQGVDPERRLEFVLHFADERGNKLDPSSLGLPPGVPNGVRHVVTFTAVDDATTEMTVTEYGYTSAQAIEISKAGLEQALDKMAATFADG